MTTIRRLLAQNVSLGSIPLQARQPVWIALLEGQTWTAIQRPNAMTVRRVRMQLARQPHAMSASMGLQTWTVIPRLVVKTVPLASFLLQRRLLVQTAPQATTTTIVTQPHHVTGTRICVLLVHSRILAPHLVSHVVRVLQIWTATQQLLVRPARVGISRNRVLRSVKHVQLARLIWTLTQQHHARLARSPSMLRLAL